MVEAHDYIYISGDLILAWEIVRLRFVAKKFPTNSLNSVLITGRMKKLALRSHMSPRAATNNPSHPITNKKNFHQATCVWVPFFFLNSPMYDLFFFFFRFFVQAVAFSLRLSSTSDQWAAMVGGEGKRGRPGCSTTQASPAQGGAAPEGGLGCRGAGR
jgi:hypothetical protein